MQTESVPAPSRSQTLPFQLGLQLFHQREKRRGIALDDGPNHHDSHHY